jgi:hypothetical protein
LGMAKNSTGKTFILVGLIALSLFAPEIAIPAYGVIQFI